MRFARSIVALARLFRVRPVLGILMLASLAVPAAGAEAETLAGVLAQAEANNPELQASRADTDIAREGLEQARAGGRTSVALTGSAGAQYTDTTGPFAFNTGETATSSLQVEASKPVFTSGRIRAGIRRAEAGISAADQALVQARQALFADVVTAYMDVRRDLEQLRIRANNVNVALEQARAARDRFDVGVVTRTDVALAEARLEGARANEAAAQAQLESSRAAFAELVGAMPETLAPPPPVPALPETLDEALAIALDANPGLASARANVRAAIEAVDAAEAEKGLTVELVGRAGYQETYADEIQDTQVTALARGSLPFWNGGLVNSRVREAQSQREQARLQVQTVERQIRAGLASAWYGYQAALRSIDSSRRQVEAAEIAYEGSKEELSVGTRTTLDVLDAEQDLFEARLAVVSAERDAYVAATQLLQVMGRLERDVFQPAGMETPAED